MIAYGLLKFCLVHDFPHLLTREETLPLLIKVREYLVISLEILSLNVPGGLFGLKHHLLEHHLLLFHHLLLLSHNLLLLFGLIDRGNKTVKLIQSIYVELVQIWYMLGDLFGCRLLMSPLLRIHETRLAWGKRKWNRVEFR
jgi:hypothetical protein